MSIFMSITAGLQVTDVGAQDFWTFKIPLTFRVQEPGLINSN